jgi:hypothetical protein
MWSFLLGGKACDCAWQWRMNPTDMGKKKGIAARFVKIVRIQGFTDACQSL